jgi:RimJ/RimL family protein N-acetyltransferase
MNMDLISPSENHVLTLMSWFSNEKELSDWSGPNFRYPFNLSSFVEDLKLNTLNSFSLVSKESELLAFGQYYQRLDKCHLGRLIVNPKLRGKGIASELIQRISELGLNDLNVQDCSLFVLSHNNKAIKAYKKMGFSFADYPEGKVLDNCLYMVKSSSSTSMSAT